METRKLKTFTTIRFISFVLLVLNTGMMIINAIINVIDLKNYDTVLAWPDVIVITVTFYIVPEILFLLLWLIFRWLEKRQKSKK